jgi:hypothetical protein
MAPREMGLPSYCVQLPKADVTDLSWDELDTATAYKRESLSIS